MSKDIHRLKVRRWKKIFHVNGNDKKLSSSNSKEKREDPMNKVRNERGDLTINIRKIKKSYESITVLCQQIGQPKING